MINIVSKKYWFFALSLLIIIPGLVSLFIWKLNLGIDFTGGSLLEVQKTQNISKPELQKIITNQGVEVASIQDSDNSYLVRTKPLEGDQDKKIKASIAGKDKNAQVLRVETVGPTIGKELLQKALLSIVVASLAVVLYIAWAFRAVSKPVSSWKFGVAAIIALIHDVLVVVGIFSILGHFLKVEVDSLFVTAILTVIGFSVHDTIVVFDRIRENLRKRFPGTFSEITNHSIIQTLGRSINTSLTVVLVLLALLLFGGSSIRWFVVALLIGVISGTFSSIFNASLILVAWEEWSEKRALAKR